MAVQPNNIAWTNVANGTPANINYANATTATLTVTPAAAAATELIITVALLV